jgi:hypothetical protein
VVAVTTTRRMTFPTTGGASREPVSTPFASTGFRSLTRSSPERIAAEWTRSAAAASPCSVSLARLQGIRRHGPVDLALRHFNLPPRALNLEAVGRHLRDPGQDPALPLVPSPPGPGRRPMPPLVLPAGLRELDASRTSALVAESLTVRGEGR